MSKTDEIAEHWRQRLCQGYPDFAAFNDEAKAILDERDRMKALYDELWMARADLARLRDALELCLPIIAEEGDAEMLRCARAALEGKP